MNRLIRGIEAVLFGGRWLLVPVYLAMILLLAMLVVYFFMEMAHALPHFLDMSENDLIILTLSLIDLSLSANLVLLVILSGYENFVLSIGPSAADDRRPAWLTKIDFTGLKLKLLGSITVIAAVHLLGSFLVIDQQSERNLLWQVIIVIVFALLSLILAFTDKLDGDSHH
jgi:uncharacterized protein (TIGR00645 family)